MRWPSIPAVISERDLSHPDSTKCYLMSRVLVTGGTGFIGQPVCRELIQGGFDVAILTRSHQINRDNKYKFIRSDLNLNQSAIADIVAFNPTEIIHLAWDGIPDFSARKCNENLQKSKFFSK